MSVNASTPAGEIWVAPHGLRCPCKDVSMRAVVISAPGVVSVEQVPDPTPKPGEAIIEVAACGICGTDLHVLQGEFAPKLPVIPGHEFAGPVVAIGDGVTQVKIGDRVGVDPSLYCGECFYCKRANDNQCENWGGLGVSTTGAAAEYVAVPAANCWHVPDSIEDLRNAALIEPLSCALHGYDVLKRRPGANYLIYGAGTMGLMMAELARKMGAASVSIVDVNTSKLEAAQYLGFEHAATSADNFDHPRGWDVVIDCTGVPKVIEEGIRRVMPAGEFLVFGVAGMDDKVEIDPYWIFKKEITIKGSMAVLHSYDRAGELFASGVLDADFLISHRLPLEAFPSALEQLRAGIGRKIQVVPHMEVSG